METSAAFIACFFKTVNNERNNFFSPRRELLYKEQEIHDRFQVSEKSLPVFVKILVKNVFSMWLTKDQ